MLRHRPIDLKMRIAAIRPPTIAGGSSKAAKTPKGSLPAGGGLTSVTSSGRPSFAATPKHTWTAHAAPSKLFAGTVTSVSPAPPVIPGTLDPPWLIAVIAAARLAYGVLTNET
jgi:hypothetical protein